MCTAKHVKRKSLRELRKKVKQIALQFPVFRQYMHFDIFLGLTL